MTIVEEFKKFIMRGSVIDLAIGIIVGGAFGKIVSSFVNDILMPPIGVILGGVKFSDLKFVLKAASGSSPEITLNYGSFIQASVDFLIIATAIFSMIKLINIMQKKEEEKPVALKEIPAQEKLLMEIRDLLRDRGQK
ncbi:MAG: large-conductance mechanosensitive channel protein MscL [Candidatus Paceibacterota bacterium]|jgi:large conductance mechanosensitive channel